MRERGGGKEQDGRGGFRLEEGLERLDDAGGRRRRWDRDQGTRRPSSGSGVGGPVELMPGPRADQASRHTFGTRSSYPDGASVVALSRGG